MTERVYLYILSGRAAFPGFPSEGWSSQTKPQTLLNYNNTHCVTCTQPYRSHRCRKFDNNTFRGFRRKRLCARIIIIVTKFEPFPREHIHAGCKGTRPLMFKIPVRPTLDLGENNNRTAIDVYANGIFIPKGFAPSLRFQRPALSRHQ